MIFPRKRSYREASSSDDVGGKEATDRFSKEFLRQKMEQFKQQRHSLRISASQVAALVGFNPYTDLPRSFIDLIYQGRIGQELLRQDAKLLGFDLISEEEMLSTLVSKAGKETKNAYTNTVKVQKGQKKLSNVQQVKDLTKDVVTLASQSGKLNRAELKQLREAVRYNVQTGFGTWNEEDALNFYEKKFGWEIHNRNEEIRNWPFVTHVDQVGTPTLVPMNIATSIFSKNKESKQNEQMFINNHSTSLDHSIQKTVSRNTNKTNTTTSETTVSASSSKNIHEIKINPKYDTIIIDDDDESLPTDNGERLERSDEEKKTERTESNQNAKAEDVYSLSLLREKYNNRNKFRKPFVCILGSIDGIRDELYFDQQNIQKRELNCHGHLNDNEDEFDNDGWELRQVLVECKHRINRALLPPPLYDQIQVVVYCLMYQINEADLVQIVRKPNNKKKCETTKVKNLGHHVFQKTTTLHKVSSEDLDHEMKNELSTIQAGKKKNNTKDSSKNDFSTMQIQDNIVVDQKLKRTVSEEEEEKGPETPPSSYLSPSSMKTTNYYENAFDVSVFRISLDDKVMQHRTHWDNIILPRLRTVVETVYTIRANDDKRYKLLYAFHHYDESTTIEQSHNGDDGYFYYNLNPWTILFQECKWLEECDTAYLHKSTH